MLIFNAAVCAAAADTFAAKQTALEEDYAAKLEALAQWCDEKKLPERAAATRAWIVPRAPLKLMAALPDEGFPQLSTDAAAPERDWLDRFRDLRRAQAKRLYELAQRSAGERDFGPAVQLLSATLREDPDHAEARRLLGYKLHAGKWLSPYEAAKVQARQVWHERFGWLPEKNVGRYESGERFFKGRWISAEDDARLHARIEQGWEISTEHYQVRTNHSLEEGVRLAGRLEEFYRVWRQVFVRYYSSDDQLARLFRDGAPPSRASRRHAVTYFRNRDEYNAALAPEQPNIGISTGYYSGAARTAYFFAGPEQDDGNIYHEATHQLFGELRPVKEPGRQANFWIVEGIACYMESYQRGNRLALLGGAEAVRLDNARRRWTEDRFHVPLAELCRLGMDDLQRRDDIRMLYSEASGLTYFLMYAQEGRYRQALVDYLAAVYANRDRRETLAELTGASYGDLDEQYHHFLEHLP